MTPRPTLRPMCESAHAHRVFAAAYAALVAVGERTPFAHWRDRALAPAQGRLLIVGLGPGQDLHHLPAAVVEVVAVEPDPAMRRHADHQLAAARVPVAMLAAVGERLPLAAASVDSVLLSLVLCSVDDPAAVLAEIRRVLRPAGRLLLLEHVRAGEGSLVGRLQDVLDPVWSRVAGGCRPNRRTRALLDAAGFDTSSVADVTIGSTVPVLAAHLCGVARAPAD